MMESLEIGEIAVIDVAVRQVQRSCGATNSHHAGRDRIRDPLLGTHSPIKLELSEHNQTYCLFSTYFQSVAFHGRQRDSGG